MKELYSHYKKTVTVFLLAIIVQSIAIAQEKKEITLKGKLKDEITGETIIGATLLIKGTKIAVQSDVEGNFELKTSQEPPFTLIVSYLGYQTKEIEIYEEDQELDFKIRSNRALSEVVVVGYGEQKRSDFTGSIGSLPSELKTQPVSSLEKLLQGAVSGVQVTQTSGQPGAGASIQIRGTGSITAGTEPLYVIDGFPIYNDQSVNDAGVVSNLGQTAGTAPKINPLSSINTSDIESIDVLKDASATAIYGSRGANGVVLITTKKGRAGTKPSINYDAYYGDQSVTRTIPLINGSEFVQLRANSLANSNPAGYVDPLLSQGKFDPTVNTDWEKAAFTHASMQNHNLSLLAGDEKTRIAFSGNYFAQNGVLQNTPFKRYAARLNVEHDFNTKFKVNTYLTASSTSAQVAPSGVVQAVLLTPPVVPIYKPDGTFNLNSPFEGTAYGNPINSLLNDVNQTKTNMFLGNVSGEYKIIEGLTAKVLFGTNVTDNKQNQYLPSTTLEGSGAKGIATIGSLFTSNWLNENTLNYTKKIARIHAFNALVGYTQQYSQTNGTIASAQGFNSDVLSFNNLGAATTPLAGSSSSTAWALQSFLARVNYGYNDKYLLTLTFRSDGSSRFGDGNKWGYFPSAAVAWNAGNEAFVKQIKQISQLKFRLSGGLTGNQQIPPYSSLSQLGVYRYTFGNTTSIGYAPNSYNNPNLSWEKTAQYDLGVDLGLFKNRITLVADIYYKKTTDLLLNVTLPSDAGNYNYNLAQGQDQAYLNTGSLENKGIELAVQSQNLIGKFKWNTNVTFASNRNKVLSLSDGVTQFIPDNSLPSVIQVGAPVGSFIVYQTNGLIAPGTPVTQALTASAQPDPNNKTLALAGQQQYKDINGDGKITQADRVVVNNQPLFIAGITNRFEFKGFDLTVFFQTSYGNKIFNQNQSLLDIGTGYTGQSTTVLDRYTPTNTNTTEHSAYTNPAATISDKYIEDGSYLRLKNISLGYTFPVSLVSKARISNLRIYVSAQNYLTITNYKGFDPEVSTNGQTPYSQGVDFGAYPNIKTVLGGLSLSF